MQDAFEALTDLVVVSLRQSLASHNTVSPVSKSAGLLPEMLHTVVDWLFVRTSPSDRELMYFGQEAFALVQQWLVTCAEDRKQASHAAGFLTHPVGLGYGRMLGTPFPVCETESHVSCCIWAARLASLQHSYQAICVSVSVNQLIQYAAS